jgi:hypothetical protein
MRVLVRIAIPTATASIRTSTPLKLFRLGLGRSAISYFLRLWVEPFNHQGRAPLRDLLDDLGLGFFYLLDVDIYGLDQILDEKGKIH